MGLIEVNRTDENPAPGITAPMVAVIEDLDALREETLQLLTDGGYAAWGAESAEAFYRALLSERADVCVVDLGLPGESGMEVICHLRHTLDCGIIALTAWGSREKRLEGFARGADHYLVKPVDPDELLAIINALWRRAGCQQRAVSPTTQWWIDPVSSELVTPARQRIALTSTEFQLLDYLMHHPGETVTKATLYHTLFSNEEDSTVEPDPHRIDVIVSRLRVKARNMGEALPIRSVFGRGLVLACTN